MCFSKVLVTFRARNQIFRIRARVLASKLLHFVSLTDCFIMLYEKLLNSILHVNQEKLLNGNFEKRAPGQIRMRQSHPPDYTIRNESPFQFTWCQNEISYQNENFIRSQNRNQLNPGKIQWNLLKNNNKKKTRIVRALWLAERCVFAWKSVNMVVTSSCFSIRALITQPRIWKSELKTRQIYYIHPLTRGLKPWKIFTNTLCLLFFA